MQKEITVKDVMKTLTEDNIDDAILVKRKDKADVIMMNVEEFKRMFEINLVQKLKRAEEQIKNNEVVDADLVFEEMRAKYGY